MPTSLRIIHCVSVLMMIMMISQCATADGDWFRDCRAQGFDPAQLACSTCDLLPKEYEEACQSCCQAFRDVAKATKPYEKAVLVVSAGSPNDEIDQFLRDDWDDLVEKVGKHRLQQEEPSMGSNSGRFFFGHTSHVYFFDDSGKKALDDAREKISLRGWSKDEIKDMLQSML